MNCIVATLFALTLASWASASVAHSIAEFSSVWILLSTLIYSFPIVINQAYFTYSSSFASKILSDSANPWLLATQKARFTASGIMLKHFYHVTQTCLCNSNVPVPLGLSCLTFFYFLHLNGCVDVAWLLPVHKMVKEEWNFSQILKGEALETVVPIPLPLPDRMICWSPPCQAHPSVLLNFLENDKDHGLPVVPLALFSSFPPEALLIKPVAVCDFNDGETCGWMHEEAAWTHRWEVEQGYLCLKAKMPNLPSRKKTSSWLSESSSLLKPLAVCDFDDGETCGWMHEEVPWTYRWAIERGRLCLKAKVSSNSSSKKISSWLQGLAIAQSDDETDVKVRFSSPTVPASLGMKCVSLAYLVEFGREKTSKPLRVSGSLSLLQQHKGASASSSSPATPITLQTCKARLNIYLNGCWKFREHSQCFRFLSFAHADILVPFHVWTFEEGDMEDWSNDNNNGQLKWHVEPTRQSSSSICVSSKTAAKKSKKFFPPTSFSKKASSRLWSPIVSSSFGINCLTIEYAIERAGHDAGLSLSQQSSG
ncbi:hypothetical protein TcWFU_006272 [Taenia crassiceps]|uniref:MAM domain-containing protein n=1 Tax=Taenia crassiceps TaxID=6207 RepID=A0ABR4QHF1_9CEST